MANKNSDIDSLGFETGQVIAYAESVSRGAKCCASITVHERNIDTVAEHLKNSEYPDIIAKTKPIADGWFELIIVRDIRLFEILDKLSNEKDDMTRNLCLGLLFGYDIISILDYVNK